MKKLKTLTEEEQIDLFDFIKNIFLLLFGITGFGAVVCVDVYGREALVTEILIWVSFSCVGFAIVWTIIIVPLLLWIYEPRPSYRRHSFK